VDSCLSGLRECKQATLIAADSPSLSVFDAQVTLSSDVQQADGTVLPGGTVKQWHDFPSIQQNLTLTNGEEARGSWIDHDWDRTMSDNQDSAFKTALARVNCKAIDEAALEMRYSGLVEDWDPEAPIIGQTPAHHETYVPCEGLQSHQSVMAKIEVEVAQASTSDWHKLPLVTNYNRTLV